MTVQAFQSLPGVHRPVAGQKQRHSVQLDLQKFQKDPHLSAKRQKQYPTKISNLGQEYVNRKVYV